MDTQEKIFLSLIAQEEEILELLHTFDRNIYKSFLSDKDFGKYTERKNIVTKIKTYLSSVSFFIQDTNEKIHKIKEELDIVKERNEILKKAYDISNINYQAIVTLYENIIMHIKKERDEQNK